MKAIRRILEGIRVSGANQRNGFALKVPGAMGLVDTTPKGEMARAGIMARVYNDGLGVSQNPGARNEKYASARIRPPLTLTKIDAAKVVNGDAEVG